MWHGTLGTHHGFPHVLSFLTYNCLPLGIPNCWTRRSIRQQAPSIADRRKFDRLLRQLLCEPYSLPSKANGQPFLRTLEPGWPTYDFLHGSYVAGMQDLWGRLRPIKGGDGDGDEGGDSDGEH